jgi:hypothetical protein
VCTFVALASGSVRAAPDAPSACPAPKPLPAGVKKPPKGANATQIAKFLLALPQRKPCDVNLFTSTFAPTPLQFTKAEPGLYPEGRPMQPKTAPVPTESQVRAQLVAFLEGSKSKGATLGLFDSSRLKSTIPDPTLRASFVALKGTVAEPLMNSFLSRPSVTVTWAPTPRRQQIAAGGGYVIFAKRYQGEHFALLSGIFAHEILHHDFPTSATEEVLLHAVNDVVHMQLLSRRPELATGGTELARFMNSDVLWWVNSRAPGSATSAIVVPKGKGTAPGSAQSRRDFYAHGKYFHVLNREPSPNDSDPAPPEFAAVLRKLLAPGVALPKPLTYSKKTAQLFSRMNDTWLSPVDRLRVSVLLGLVSMDEVTKYTGLTRPQATATFELAPILAAMR